jgi:hypothetical protein
MNSQTFELFFTFSAFFTSHVFDSKARYIRRLISFEEIRLISSQRDCFREWRNEICVQLNQIMNETTSLWKTQQLHDEIVVFEIFVSHDYFEALKRYLHMKVISIRQEMRKTLNEYLTTFLNFEVEETAFCSSSSFLSSDLVFAWESSSLKKMRIESKLERLVLIVKKVQNEISSVKAAAKKYDVCWNIIFNKIRDKRIMFEYVMNCQLLVSHKEEVILTFVNRFIKLRFFSRLFMLKEKIELILREREHNVNLSHYWIDRFLIRHSEYRTKFFDISIKNVISTLIEKFSRNDSNYLIKRVWNMKSSMRTYTTWMKKTIWWKWRAR